MIEKFNLSQLRNADFITYGRDVLNLFKEYDLPAIGLQATVNTFEKELHPVLVKFDLEKGNTLALEMEQSDLRRDNAIIGIRQVADAHTRHYDTILKKAAEILLKCIARYGNSAIAYQNYYQETESILKLVADFENIVEVKHALDTLGLVDWAAELKEANQEFEKLYQKKMSNQPDNQDVNLKDLRNNAKESYEGLIQFLVATHTVQPKDVFRKLIAEVNLLNKEYSKILAAQSELIQQSDQS